MVNYITWKDNLVHFATEGFNFDKSKSEGLHEMHEALRNHLIICLKGEEDQENLCRVGQSQDLSDAH
jgi:hypothetical protein